MQGVPMTSLRTAVLMKTDIAGSTSRFRALRADDQQSLLREHRVPVVRYAAEHKGQVVKAAGDGFWLEFPSVTAAAKAAVAMQESLRLGQPIRGEDRLSMRIVIGLGDIGDLDGEMLGEVLALIVRIEAIAPADEVYLTPAARLALIPAEVQASRVDSFAFKGFTDPIEVHRVEQRNRSCIMPDACILLSDLRGFTRITDSEPIAVIERVLTALENMINAVVHEFGGIIRYSLGDSHCLTFDAAADAMAAAERLSADWNAAGRRDGFGCAINLALHRGAICAFRSFLYGKGMAVAARVQRSSLETLGPDEGGIFVTEALHSALLDRRWRNRLVPTGLALPDARVFRLLAVAPTSLPPIAPARAP